jgi:UPF0042 nucleotide-binding protein
LTPAPGSPIADAISLVVVTGMSGSGKSVALAVLEDEGFYCVDNLPVALIGPLVKSQQARGTRQMALAADVRVGADLAHLEKALSDLRAEGIALTVLFLNARSDILLQRYSETRRRHPLSLLTETNRDDTGESMTLMECIEHEREILAPLQHLGIPVDTSDLRSSALRTWLRAFLKLEGSGLVLLFQSFAFKSGIPLDADLVFDLRCLPNPHYVAELKPLTGRDPEVAAYLASHETVGAMVKDIGDYLEKWLACYVQEQRSYLTVALGCTGGQHRSVYGAEQLASRFGQAWPVMVRHRSLIQRGLG